MFRRQSLRALVTARLSAAAEDIFELFERTIAEYEDELCLSKAKNQRSSVPGVGVRTLSLSPGLGLKPGIIETVQIKEEQSVKQEEEQLPVCVPEVTAVCVKTEEKRQSDYTDDDDCEQMETEVDRDQHTVHQEYVSGDEGAEGTEGMNHKCPFCQKLILNKHKLQRHIRIHTGEKPYSCSFCQKQFGRNDDLKKHIRVHTGERPYSCTICNKTFTNSSVQKTHMRIHTGEKPYSCAFCNKAFAKKIVQEQHMRTHTGERPYSCSVCGKTFIKNDGLYRHMKIHTGERPFSCAFCSKSFTQKTVLEAHTRTHTGERPFSCAVCQKTFVQSSGLMYHRSSCKRRPAEDHRSCMDTKLRAGVRMPSQSPVLDLNQEIPETPQIKEDPEEQRVKREDEQLPLSVPESSTVCVKTEESSLLQKRQTKHKEETQGKNISFEPHIYLETEGHNKQSSDSETDDWSAATSTALFPKQNIASETNATIHQGNTSGVEGAERKKHQCSVCEKRFKKKHVLQTHIRVHTGERPFSCSVCQKTFSQPSNLKRHMVTHRADPAGDQTG